MNTSLDNINMDAMNINHSKQTSDAIVTNDIAVRRASPGDDDNEEKSFNEDVDKSLP